MPSTAMRWFNPGALCNTCSCRAGPASLPLLPALHAAAPGGPARLWPHAMHDPLLRNPPGMMRRRPPPFSPRRPGRLRGAASTRRPLNAANGPHTSRHAVPVRPCRSWRCACP